jgi:exportin-2 (importin alpha re-exporter)
MLELHTTDVPMEYRNLLPFLLTPAIWQQKGSIPGLVKLLKAFLAKNSLEGQLGSVLAVIQQRLIPSKMNDGWGFELLHSVLQHVSPYVVVMFIHILFNVLSGPSSDLISRPS